MKNRNLGPEVALLSPQGCRKLPLLITRLRAPFLFLRRKTGRGLRALLTIHIFLAGKKFCVVFETKGKVYGRNGVGMRDTPNLHAM